MTTPITVAYGDGIGPEIMEAVILILKEARAQIRIDTVEIGARANHHGFKSGIPDSCWEIIRRNKILLKAPITTPQGGGYKSVNVTLRRALGLYANIRPCVSYHPFVGTKHPEMDVVIIRENEEDLYSGIEHRQTQNAYQSLKLMTRQGCEKINKYAFDYATNHARKKVTCFTKDNIMKMTDGLFHKVFNDIAENYPDIKNEHYIVDIGAARLSSRPENFDVIVTANLYGDIISDIVSEISGSVGLAGSANIGQEFAMFEAVHGSAPDIAGQGIANPSGLLNGAIMMLVHIGQYEVATKIHNAWLKTIEDGIHTGDIYNESVSKEKASTETFTKAVIARLGQKPEHFKPVTYSASTEKPLAKFKFHRKKEQKQLIGVDVFFDWEGGDAEILAGQLNNITGTTALKLQMLDTRGFKVWPASKIANLGTSDHWRARFFPEGTEKSAVHSDIVELLNALQASSLDFIRTENLYTFDGELGFSLAQGE
ncbi:MAG: NADP-dependent isocitrate dehydrogenase [Rickettsiaceae bacterium]|jgi:isocitrate dehydrogenase|nr:NADP-dependent isocitrate dehydrogenase [Rickettsiaceae bacterium]